MKMDDKNREYSNDEITVYWRPGHCIHASICYTKLIEVFNPIKRPWVNLSGAPTGRIIEIVNECPTEALMWKWNDERKNEQVTESDKNHVRIRRPDDYKSIETAAGRKDPVQVKVMKNGPYVIQGSFRVLSEDGQVHKTGRFTSLCRCGQSNTMPFCDGMHRKTGFQDE